MSLKKKTTIGIFWSTAEMIGGQAINFIVNIVLARLLVPEDYGLLGMIFIFITLGNTLVDSGFGMSLIRTDDAKEVDYSTCFISNVIFAVIVYFIIFLLAPVIANFYGKDLISSIIRLYSLTIIIQAFYSIHYIHLVKSINFKKQTLFKLPAIIISSVIAIYLASNKYGVWSLVWMYLLQNLFLTIFYWLFGGWKPKFKFDYNVFIKHFSFGYKISIVELLNNASVNINQIVIGKFFNPQQVGYYTQALTLRQVPISNIYMSIAKVLIPVFSQIKNDIKEFSTKFFKFQEFFLILLFPILSFLAFFSKAVIVVIFTEKWANAAPHLSVLSVAGMFTILVYWHLVAVKLINEGKVIVRYEISLKLFQFLVIAVALYFFKENIIKFLYSIIIIGLTEYLVYSYLVSKTLHIQFKSLHKNVIIYSTLTFITGLISLKLNYLFFHQISLFSLIIIGIIFMLVNFLLILIFKKKALVELMQLINVKKIFLKDHQ